MNKCTENDWRKRMTSGDAMDIGNLRASAATAEVYIRDVKFPASKQHLIESARKNEAPDGVMEVFKRIPDKEYATSLDLLKAINQVVLISAYKKNLGPDTPGIA
jgi:hypothetical protein